MNRYNRFLGLFALSINACQVALFSVFMISILIKVTSQIVVAFPDDGAWKRFHKQLDHFPMVGLNFCLK